MGGVGRWKMMKYGTDKRDTERDLGFMLFCICSAEQTKGRNKTR